MATLKELKEVYGTRSVTEEDKPTKTFELQNKGGRNTDYLKIDDIVNDPDMLDKVRDYMVDRKGKQYMDADPEEMVDEWMEHMRWFNTNEVYTVGEVSYISRADENKRARAGEAYKIYDQLGGFWHNDGLGGAVDGLFDYTKAILASPSTYLGFGVGKGLTMVGGKASAEALKKLAMRAAREKARDIRFKSANPKSLKLPEGGKEQVRQAYNDIVAKASKDKSKKVALTTGVVDASVVVPQDSFLQKTEIKAGSREAYNPLQTVLSAATVGAGTAIGMRFIADKAPRDSYVGKSRRIKELSRERYQIDKKSAEWEKLLKEVSEGIKADKDEFVKSYKETQKNYTEFRKGAKEGELFQATQSQEWMDRSGRIGIEDGVAVIKKGDKIIKPGTDGFEPDFMRKLVSIMDRSDYSKYGVKFTPDIPAAERLAIVIQNLNRGDKETEQLIKDLNDMVYANTGMWLGDVADEITYNLGNQVRHSASKYGSGLQVLSTIGKKQQMNKGIDQALVQGSVNRGLLGKADEVIAKASDADNVDSPQWGRWVQGLWKRMIVSTPQTTAINVFGFGQLYAMNAASELLQSFTLLPVAMAQTIGGNNVAAKKSLQQARALVALQAQKLKNFADPYSTREMYIELLNANPELKKKLYETIAGGVDIASEKLKIDASNPIFRHGEAITTLAQNMSGVQLQDTITKSQAFVTNLDKHLRLQKNVTLDEMLQKGDLSVLDAETMSMAGRDTLQAVFSADYKTTAKIGDAYAGEFTFGKGQKIADKVAGVLEIPQNLGASMANIVEYISNQPLLGYFLPFGRFMNNVVATAYQYNPITGNLMAAAQIARGSKMGATEAFAKAQVGSVLLGTMMSIDKQKAEKGQAWNEVQMGDGTIIDATNTFPASLVLVAARVRNRQKNNEPVSRELQEDFLKQLAIGQISRDLDFGKDLTKLFRAFDIYSGNPDSGEGGSVGANALADLNRDSEYSIIGKSIDAVGIGGILSGFTRPLDPFNRIIGIAAGTDEKEDPRLPRSGAVRFTKDVTKYTDNIFEALFGRLGEPQQAATQEGPVRDPAPIVTMTGIKVKPTRTYANMVFGMVDFPDWKASLYTGIPEHDNFVNKAITPILERNAEALLKSKKFRELPLIEKRERVEEMLRRAKRQIHDTLDLRYDTEEGINRRKMRLDRTKRSTLRRAREMLNITVPIIEMTPEELTSMEAAIATVKLRRKQPLD